MLNNNQKWLPIYSYPERERLREPLLDRLDPLRLRLEPLLKNKFNLKC